MRSRVANAGRTSGWGGRIAALLALGCVVDALGQGGITNRFGFTGPEIFPIDNLISQIRHADLDGDGLEDLVVANNNRSKISLLYNRTGQPPGSRPAGAKRELNELPPDARFQIESIASEKTLSALVVTDLDGNRRPDLAYYGTPKELVVQYHEGTNAWGAPKRWAIDDGLMDPNALTSGDLNGDGREDLLLLGESAAYFLAQQPDHTLADPEKIPYQGGVKAARILDIDGDGRSDLVLVNWEHAYPFRVRLQTVGGQLGPEMHFALPPVRSCFLDDLDNDHRTEVITIAAKSGRAQVSNFSRKSAELLGGAFRQGQFQVLPLVKTTKNRRGLVWADLDGDRLTDLLAAEPESGQISLFLQQPDGVFAACKTFPSFTGIGDVAVADWDGDQRPEVFVLSTDERQVGVSRVDAHGGVPFPATIAVEGRPLALAVGSLRSGQPPQLAVIVEQDGKRELVLRDARGKTRRQRLSESFKANPSALLIHDINQDERPDLVLLIPYEKVKVLLQVEDGPFEEQDVAPPGGSAEQPWARAADVDGDGREELLLAQKNFVRAVLLQPETLAEGSTNKPGWVFAVKEQINGASSSSRIVGAVPLCSGTNRVASLFLLDAERKALTLCERDPAGVWQAGRSVSLPVSDFAALEPVVLGGPHPQAVAFIGLNAVAWLSLGGEVWEFKVLDDYETPIRDGYLMDVVSGDLNQDGRKDLVFLETSKNHLDLVTFDPPHRLVPADRWQVFEERTFKGRRPEAPEPREAVIADFTGDGRNDLAVIVHDRVLVYPQE